MIDKGYIKEAIHCYVTAIRLMPKFSAAHSNLGTLEICLVYVFFCYFLMRFNNNVPLCAEFFDVISVLQLFSHFCLWDQRKFRTHVNNT